MNTLIILFAVIAAASGVAMLFTPAVPRYVFFYIFFTAMLITVGLKMITTLFHSCRVEWTDVAAFTAFLLGVMCTSIGRLKR